MAKKVVQAPTLLAVSGGQDILRQRFVRRFIETQRAAGWDVAHVDGSDPVSVRDALQGGNPFAEVSKTLVVAFNPEKMDLDLLARHQQSKDSDVTVLLHVEGEPDGRTKFGKFVKGLGDSLKSFSKPDRWKEPEVAAAFIVEEAKSHGKTIRESLAQALVELVGTDLGMLAFEVEKMSLLADARGVTVLNAEEVRGGMAPIAEASAGPIIDALATRDRKKLVKALGRVKTTSSSDPTMGICRFLAATVTKWLKAVYLDNLPPQAAASELGMNPWYFENKVLPAARRWGKKGTVQLIADLAAAERAVLSGAVSPWTVLSARLLSSC